MVDVALSCPHCESAAIRLPAIQAPDGYAFDSSLVLISCSDCGHRGPMNAFTMIDGERDG